MLQSADPEKLSNREKVTWISLGTGIRINFVGGLGVDGDGNRSDEEVWDGESI